MIKFDPKQAISLFVKTSATAIAAANGADPETAAIAGDAAEAITGGISFHLKRRNLRRWMQCATRQPIQ